MTTTSARIDALDFDAISELQDYCHQSARDKGFHKSTDALNETREAFAGTPMEEILEDAFRDRVGNRLMLIAGEVIEAHEAVRAGHAPDEEWVTISVGGKDSPTVVPAMGDDETVEEWADRVGIPLKPEGVPSEIADVVIRCLDFAGEHGIDLAAVIQRKLQYNATRAAMHGGKKF